jgi:hypothetical protein
MTIAPFPHWSAQQTEMHAARVTLAAWAAPLPTEQAARGWALTNTDAALAPRRGGAFAQPVVYAGRAYYSSQEWQMYETERTGNP